MNYLLKFCGGDFNEPGLKVITANNSFYALCSGNALEGQCLWKGNVMYIFFISSPSEGNRVVVKFEI